jgi:hypothetical protein
MGLDHAGPAPAVSLAAIRPFEPEGATRFSMRERFGGRLLPLIARSMPDLGPSFDQFAPGLKEMAERGD